MLNTVHRRERRFIINDCWQRLRKNGMLILVTRTKQEIEKLAEENKWFAFYDGFLTSKYTFQKGFTNSGLASLIRETLIGKDFYIEDEIKLSCKCSLVAVRKTKN